MSEYDQTEPTRQTAGSRPLQETRLPQELRSLIGQQLAGCTVDKVLGQGSMGAVFLAREHALGGRLVAIKVLLPTYAEQPEYLERFQREAAAAAGLNSDHVVKIYRHGKQGTLPFLVMELVDGGTLLKQNDGKRLGYPEIVRQLRQACEGLLAAERKGLVHRDLKPANIMVANRHVGRGRGQTVRADVKIVDFGVARPTQGVGMTQLGTFVGSPLYASPEQWKLDQVTHLSDMYSLGATFYQLLAGRPAPPERGEREVRDFTLNTPFLSPRVANPDVPPELDAVIAKMTACDPANRFESFADVIDALNAVEDKWRGPKEVVVNVEAPPPRWPWYALAGTVLVAVLAVWFLGRPSAGIPQRDAVLERLAQAGPDGPLTQRRQRLFAATRDLPPAMAESAPAKQLVASLTRLDAQLENLRQMDTPRLRDPTVTGVDWARLLEQLGPPPTRAERDGEAECIAQLDEAIAALRERETIGVELERIGTALRDDPAADLARLKADVVALQKRCVGERGGVFTEAVSKLNDEVEKSLRCMAEINECRRSVEEVRRRLLTDDAEQLAKCVVPNLSVGVCAATRAAVEGLRPTWREIGQAHRWVAERHKLLDEALKGTGTVDAFTSKVGAAWPAAEEVPTGNAGDWWRRAREGYGRQFIDAMKQRIQAAGDRSAPSATSDESLDAIEKALARAEVVRILAELNRGGELKDQLAAAKERSRPSVRATPAAIDFPPEWPKEWPRDVGPQSVIGRLKSRKSSEGRTLYQYGDDAIDMVLVPVRDGTPFLVDVQQVTYRRMQAAGLLAGGRSAGYARFLKNVPVEQRTDTLVVEVLAEVAMEYANSKGKALMSKDQWQAVEALLGPRNPDQMIREYERIAKRDPSLPMAVSWPGDAASAFFSVGVCDLVRDGSGFAAVGHTLFRPKDKFAKVLEGDDARRYYRSPPPAESIPEKAQPAGTHVGFRCVLPLEKLPR